MHVRLTRHRLEKIGEASCRRDHFSPRRDRLSSRIIPLYFRAKVQLRYYRVDKINTIINVIFRVKEIF